MSYKIATYVSLTLIMGLALLFFFTSNGLTNVQSNQLISPATFPRIVSVLLMIACIISLFTTIKKKDEKAEMPNLKFFIYTILTMIVFLSLWQLVGYFYILSFIMLAFLFFLYSDNPNYKQRVFKSIMVAVIVVLFIYLSFDRVLGIIF